MLTSILLAAVAGGVVVFVWGAISWMALPWHHATYSPFTDEEAVVRALEANAPVTGVYGIPQGDCHGLTAEEKKAKQAAMMERMKRGPLVLAVVVRRGMASMGPYLVRGFVIGVVVSGLLAWLLTLTRTNVVGLLDRALFVAFAGLAGTLAVRLNEWNWHGFTTRYTVVNIVDGFVGWFLAGLAIAAVLP